MRTHAAYALLLAAITVLVPRATAAGGAFALVVNQHNAVASLSASEMKKIISGGLRVWDDGSVVQIGIIPSDAPETEYLASLLDTSPRELLSLIQQQVFKGELRRPAVLRSSADCVAFASSVAGAICVASANVPIPAGARAVPLR